MEHFPHVGSYPDAELIDAGGAIQRSLQNAQRCDFIIDVDVTHVSDPEHFTGIGTQSAGHDHAFFHQCGTEFGIIDPIGIDQVRQGDGPVTFLLRP